MILVLRRKQRPLHPHQIHKKRLEEIWKIIEEIQWIFDGSYNILNPKGTSYNIQSSDEQATATISFDKVTRSYPWLQDFKAIITTDPSNNIPHWNVLYSRFPKDEKDIAEHTKTYPLSSSSCHDTDLFAHRLHKIGGFTLLGLSKEIPTHCLKKQGEFYIVITL